MHSSSSPRNVEIKMWECSKGTLLETGTGCNPHCTEAAHGDRAMFMWGQECRQSSPFLAVSSGAAGDSSGRHRTGKIRNAASRTPYHTESNGNLAWETTSGSATMALAACLHGSNSRNGIGETPGEPLAAWGQPSQQCSHHQQGGEQRSSKNVGSFGRGSQWTQTSF